MSQDLSSSHVLALQGSSLALTGLQLHEPSREIRAGVLVIVLFFVILLGWAAVAPLNAAAFAPGRLVVDGQRQTVQHRDGGVIDQIAVREGQVVHQGDVLVRLVETDVRAREHAMSAQAIALLAQRARLVAEQAGQARVIASPELTELGLRHADEVRDAISLQQRQLDARRALLETQQRALAQRTRQARSEAAGNRIQSRTTGEEQLSVGREFDELRPLQEKGFVSASRLHALERARLELEGQHARFQAAARSAEEAAIEARLRVLGGERTHMDELATELRQVEAAIQELMPRLAAAQDQLTHTVIRAPVTGSVLGLSIFTRGGVIAPGQRIMDIVPSHAALRIEARISPIDADDLRIGQTARVRFTSFHDRRTPTLVGKITRVSADSLTDPHNGSSFYTAELIVSDSELSRLTKSVDRAVELRPGTPVQISVDLHKRTALQYALEPLIEGMWGSFGEH